MALCGVILHFKMGDRSTTGRGISNANEGDMQIMGVGIHAVGPLVIFLAQCM